MESDGPYSLEIFLNAFRSIDFVLLAPVELPVAQDRYASKLVALMNEFTRDILRSHRLKRKYDPLNLQLTPYRISIPRLTISSNSRDLGQSAI